VNFQRGCSWKFKPFEDCPAIFTSKPPFWFHRLMQRVLLGFKWTRE
jgi:hypothetical protein